MARARQIERLDCEGPFAQAAAWIVSVRAAEVFAHSDRVLDLKDTERLHDMRVATRRLRAALEVFEPCFSRKRHRKALKRVKALADALGERRDRDVMIGLLAELIAEAEDGEGAGLIEGLREEQRAANQALASYVKPKRLRKLHRRLDRLVAEARV